ncbi:hypothetical protein ON010_g7203 [Phytophthora cinnamomi]|nr:hypothetical protein ON010_g7203 [Phytophthora cinnamomi]
MIVAHPADVTQHFHEGAGVQVQGLQDCGSLRTLPMEGQVQICFLSNMAHLMEEMEAFARGMCTYNHKPTNIYDGIVGRFQVAEAAIPNLATVQHFVQYYRRAHSGGSDFHDDIVVKAHKRVCRGEEELSEPFTFTWRANADGEPIVGRGSDADAFVEKDYFTWRPGSASCRTNVLQAETGAAMCIAQHQITKTGEVVDSGTTPLHRASKFAAGLRRYRSPVLGWRCRGHEWQRFQLPSLAGRGHDRCDVSAPRLMLAIWPERSQAVAVAIEDFRVVSSHPFTSASTSYPRGEFISYDSVPKCQSAVEPGKDTRVKLMPAILLILSVAVLPENLSTTGFD